MSTATDKKPDEKRSGLSKKAIVLIIFGLLILVPLMIWLFTPPDPATKRVVRAIEPDAGVIIVKTTYPGIPIHLDPNQAITIAPVMGNIGWEQAVNGIPTKRFPLKGKSIDLVDQDEIGEVRTAACRILENQGIDKAEFVYIKHPKHTEPPSGWFDLALNSRRQ